MKVNYKPDDRMERDIAEIGCDVHIVNACAQSSRDVLPTETAALILDIYTSTQFVLLSYRVYVMNMIL
jgi:hypothetical protein